MFLSITSRSTSNRSETGPKNLMSTKGDTFHSPLKANGKAELKITPVKKRKLDLQEESSEPTTGGEMVLEEEENCHCPANLSLLRIISRVIESEGPTELNLKDLRALHEAVRKKKEEIVSLNGSSLSAENTKSCHENARSLIEDCTKDRKTSMVASIVCDYVDKGENDIGYLLFVQKTGSGKGFQTKVPSWSWMAQSLTSLYDLGLSRFR